MTALFAAAATGRVQVIKILLAAGAIANHADRSGATAMFFAKTKEVINVLVAAGADCNHKNNKGQTPMFLAAAHGWADVINGLVEHSAVINQELNGETPIFEAASRGNSCAVSALIAAGATIVVNSPKARNLLRTAARASHYRVCTILLAAGADYKINKEDLSSEILNLLKLWELKVANKDKPLCEQVLVILNVSLDWSTSISGFFSTPEIIKVFTAQQNNPEFNNNVEHLESLLNKHRPQLAVTNFEFVMEFILPKKPIQPLQVQPVWAEDLSTKEPKNK